MTIIKLGEEPGTTASDLSPSALEVAMNVFRKKFEVRPDLLLVSEALAAENNWLESEEVQPLWHFIVTVLPNAMCKNDAWALMNTMTDSVLWSPGPS